MSEGEALLHFVEEMRTVHVQIASLLGTADELLRERGWKPAIGATCAAYGSASLDNPRQWMPSEFFRFHRNQTYRGALAYVAVVLLPHPADDQPLRLDEPFVTAGWFDYAEDPAVTVDNQWYCRWHLYGQAARDGSIIETRKNALPEAELGRFRYGFERARTMAVPLVEVTDAEMVSARIVKPLVRDIEAAREKK